jgi:hypothetical protein
MSARSMPEIPPSALRSTGASTDDRRVIPT